MKRTLWLVIAFLFPLLTATAQRQWGDMGDGTYRNPILPSDYSDPDVIRVDSIYYMVASDFHFMGMQLLCSRDLVNWRVLTQVYRRLDYPGWDANVHYGDGSWAPSLRWHDGRFWIYFCTPDEGLFMTNATDPAGPWSPLRLVKSVKKWEDPCPFWDDDGRAYLGHSVHRAGPIIVHRMTADGTQLLDSGRVVYRGPVAEGTKFYKCNGYYYLCIPEGGVGQGWQTCLRSRNIYGPYERRIVLEQGSTGINGPHQGALVDTPDDSLFFIHFQERSPMGRIIHLQPARWQDDWPVIGVDFDGNGVGEPVETWHKPTNVATNDSIQVSDDFASSVLLPVWQWNHNPVDTAWSLNRRQGMLTLTALPAENFRLARNTLTQKLIGFDGELRARMMTDSMADGQRAGLAFMGKENHLAGIMKEGGQLYVYAEANDTMLARQPYTDDSIEFVGRFDMKDNRFTLDCAGSPLALPPFPMKNGYWKGARVALYNYNTKGNGGSVSFESFAVK